MITDNVSVLYSWGQFAPAIALVVLAVRIPMADCFTRLPKRV